jgi:AmiR/NasT family two-component response regulator
MSSFSDECDAYVVKPIKKTKLVEELRRLELIR